MSDTPTTECIIAGFDVDNTLLDPDMRAYTATVTEFLRACDLGLTPEQALAKYESFRSAGNALERIGLRNPIHYRGNPEALAVFCMTTCINVDLRATLGIGADETQAYCELLAGLAEADKATRSGSWEERLRAECHARALTESNPQVTRLRAEARRIACQPRIVEWAETYRALEQGQPVDELLPLMQLLSSRGIRPVVISEGRLDVQLEKLQRLGLVDFFRGRILITESAADIQGGHELNEAISERIVDGNARASHETDDELSLLWYFRCLIDTWAGKSPSFYGRCLHALQYGAARPQDSFDTPVYLPDVSWEQAPLRFLMVGDRYDKDVAPVLDLLGRSVGMTIRLRQGKYGHLHPEDELPADRHPHRTFTDWASLGRFLTQELSAEQVTPITASPDLVSKGDIRAEYIRRGLESSHQAVRSISRVVTQMLDQPISDHR